MSLMDRLREWFGLGYVDFHDIPEPPCPYRARNKPHVEKPQPVRGFDVAEGATNDSDRREV